MNHYTYHDEVQLTDRDATRSIYRTSDNLQAKYDVMRRYGVQQETFENWVIRQLSLTGAEKVLDIGCGEGRFLLPIAHLLKDGGEIVGCDLSKGVMASAQETISAELLPAHLIVADAEALPFQAGMFDLAMANHMLYHVNVQSALNEADRVLKLGGRFLATTNSQHHMPEMGTLHFQTMKQLGIEYSADGNEPFCTENGLEQLESVFSEVELLTYEAGFRISDPQPVLQYYMATQLYQGPYHEPSLPRSARESITGTFSELAQAMINQAGGSLLISKPVGAFICRKGY